jgi:DNA-binding response OmpR family regulator
VHGRAVSSAAVRPLLGCRAYDRSTLTWICVIDDEPDVCDTLTDALRGAGYDVQGFQSGADALAAIDGAIEPPRLVILDLLLAGLSGRDVLRRIRTGRRASNVPVIVVTGTDDDETSLSPWPVAAVMHKPISMDQFLATVAVALPPR